MNYFINMIDIELIFYTSGIRSLLRTSSGHGEVKSKSNEIHPFRIQESLN